MRRLRLITYLAPSLPAALFETIAGRLGATLQFETRISGPLEGDDEPFTSGAVDLGFICAPSYRVLRPAVELLPALVPLDPRAASRPVYFADVVVRASSAFRTFDELRGARWAYNDRNSKSGWFSMLERTGGEAFFGAVVQSGSHVQSLEFVADGRADAAAIDSNVLALHRRDDLRVIESWGPFPIQPAVVRAALPEAQKRAIANDLLAMRAELEPFGFRGFAPADERAYL
jgi:phosphonate transport system substrate-binding protein